MWLPAKFTINYIPKKFNLFYFLYFIFSYFKLTISTYMWPFFANIMYLHLFMLSESLLCESQLSINFSSWLAVKISSETEDPRRNKLLYYIAYYDSDVTDNPPHLQVMTISDDEGDMNKYTAWIYFLWNVSGASLLLYCFLYVEVTPVNSVRSIIMSPPKKSCLLLLKEGRSVIKLSLHNFLLMKKSDCHASWGVLKRNLCMSR